jgi:ADP-heptose:LPS heptosyltransferase
MGIYEKYDITQEEVFAYLIDLRDSGETNMLAAPSYLEKEFGFSREEAREVFWEWAYQLEREDDD